MPLRNNMIAHKEEKYFHPQKTYCSFNKDLAGLLILMQCINKLYLLMICDGLKVGDHITLALRIVFVLGA